MNCEQAVILQMKENFFFLRNPILPQKNHKKQTFLQK